MSTATDNTAGFVSFDQFTAMAPGRLQAWHRAAVLLVNLRHFRNVNYALGHAIGTTLLRDAEQRIGSLLPAGAMAARVGSRFPVLLPDATLEAAQAFSQQLRAAFERPLQVSGFGCELSIHIGMALAPEHGNSHWVLLRKADVALYQANERGVSIGIYDPAQDPHTPERLSLLGELRGAIPRGELQLYCQPKIDMRTGEVTGAESLVRWHHPTRGVIGPAAFVPMIETTDLIMVLTEYMLVASARQAAAWFAQYMAIPLAVNLSTRDVSTMRLSSVLPGILANAGASSDTLGLEVTEGSLLSSPQDSIAELRRLRALGFELYVDDFGTGFSSLSYLVDLPVQVLKIDYSFTSRMLHDRRAASIVRATIGLAHELDFKVVAEGAADRPTWEALDRLGCDQAQGYYVSAPFPAGQMRAWLDAAPYRPRHPH
jgi:diguanylate cyclase (GGDEF)-like protein